MARDRLQLPPWAVVFGDRATAALFHGERVKHARRIPTVVHAVALRKLDQLNAARELGDLRAPPGNQLEALKGDRKGFHSIRVNDQWRLTFRWVSGEAHDVRVEDYH